MEQLKIGIFHNNSFNRTFESLLKYCNRDSHKPSSFRYVE